MFCIPKQRLAGRTFFQSVRQSSQSIRLKSLELQHGLEYDEAESGDDLARFLAAFDGLEELLIASSHPRSLDIWRAAVHHKASLRRLVHHQRAVDADGDECDVPSFMRVPKRPAALEDPSRNPLRELSLDYFGVACTPQYLVRDDPDCLTI